MLHQNLAWRILLLLAAASQATAGELSDVSATVTAWVRDVDVAIAAHESAARAQGHPADITSLPGRDEFTASALALLPVAEAAGMITADAEAAAEQPGADVPKVLLLDRALDRMLRRLGRLKAAGAAATLTRYISSGLPVSGSVWEFDFPDTHKPALAALIEIGEPALPALVANIERSDNARIGWWSAYAIGAILGEGAPSYYAACIDRQTEPALRARLKAVEPQIVERSEYARSRRIKAEEKERAAAQKKAQALAAEVIE